MLKYWPISFTRHHLSETWMNRVFWLPGSSSILFSKTTMNTSHRQQSVIRKKMCNNYANLSAIPSLQLATLPFIKGVLTLHDHLHISVWIALSWCRISLHQVQYVPLELEEAASSGCSWSYSLSESLTYPSPSFSQVSPSLSRSCQNRF